MYKGKTVYPTKPQNGPMDKIVNENWDKPKALLKDALKKDAQIYDNWDTKFFVEEGSAKNVDAQIYDNWDTKFFVEKGSAKTGSIYNQGQRSENSYHFETEVKEEAVDENETLQKKPYPHLNTVEDWEFWKASMLSMKSNMKNYSNILALYMYCHLQ